MPPWRAIRRRELIATLRRLGFDGPYSGGKHEFMARLNASSGQVAGNDGCTRRRCNPA
jgi:hypothetical protein